MNILHMVQNLLHPPKTPQAPPQYVQPPVLPLNPNTTHVFGGAVPPEGMYANHPFQHNIPGLGNFMQSPMRSRHQMQKMLPLYLGDEQ